VNLTETVKRGGVHHIAVGSCRDGASVLCSTSARLHPTTSVADLEPGAVICADCVTVARNAIANRQWAIDAEVARLRALTEHGQPSLPFAPRAVTTTERTAS